MTACSLYVLKNLFDDSTRKEEWPLVIARRPVWVANLSSPVGTAIVLHLVRVAILWRLAWDAIALLAVHWL